MLARRPLHSRAFAALTFAAAILAAASCKETSGPATAVTLTLYSVDGVVVPVHLRTAGGQVVTLARGLLQGTNWGHACGFAAGLAEGRIADSVLERSVRSTSCSAMSGFRQGHTRTGSFLSS